MTVAVPAPAILCFVPLSIVTAEYNGFVYCTCEDGSTTLALLFPLVCLPAVTQMEVYAAWFDVEDLRITLRFS